MKPGLLHSAAALLVAVAAISACSPAARSPGAQPSAAALPTAAATPAPPTPEPHLAADLRVAGVDVSGKTLAEARGELEEALAPLARPLEVQLGDLSTTLRPGSFGFELPIDELLAAALRADEGARIPLRVSFDEDKLRAELESLATKVARPASVQLVEVPGTKGKAFAVQPGARLDTDAAVEKIGELLRSPGAPRRLTLSLAPEREGARPTIAQLSEQIAGIEKEWGGVVGVYLYDLSAREESLGYHENTTFSAMSVMKAAIMLHAYAKIAELTPEQSRWTDDMIVRSDNWAANAMLAAGAGGKSPNDAARGALAMSEMLADLGLEHTYMRSPYATGGYPIDFTGLKVEPGPVREGEEPYTESSRYLRTTPAEISRVFLWIEQCRQDDGPLPEAFPETLTPERCGEMLERLEHNADQSRLVAGLPEGTRVAHKSGWIEDANGDAGIVRSPNGDYLAAIFVYRDQASFNEDRAAATIARISRLIYTYFNPLEPA